MCTGAIPPLPLPVRLLSVLLAVCWYVLFPSAATKFETMYRDRVFDVTVCRCDDSDDEVVYFDGAAKAGGECRSANDTCMDWC